MGFVVSNIVKVSKQNSKANIFRVSDWEAELVIINNTSHLSIPSSLRFKGLGSGEQKNQHKGCLK